MMYLPRFPSNDLQYQILTGNDLQYQILTGNYMRGTENGSIFFYDLAFLCLENITNPNRDAELEQWKIMIVQIIKSRFNLYLVHSIMCKLKK